MIIANSLKDKYEGQSNGGILWGMQFELKNILMPDDKSIEWRKKILLSAAQGQKLVVLNEAQFKWFPNIVDELRKINQDMEIGISINTRDCYFNKEIGKYYPFYKKLQDFCYDNDCFMKRDNGSFVNGWENTYVVDYTYPGAIDFFLDNAYSCVYNLADFNFAFLDQHQDMLDGLYNTAAGDIQLYGFSIQRFNYGREQSNKFWKQAMLRIKRKIPACITNGQSEVTPTTVGKFIENALSIKPIELISNGLSLCSQLPMSSRRIIFHSIFTTVKEMNFLRGIANLCDGYCQIELEETFIMNVLNGPSELGNPLDYLNGKLEPDIQWSGPNACRKFQYGTQFVDTINRMAYIK